MTDKQIKKYCDGLDCSICNEKEPCIYKIANELEEKLLAKEKECYQLKVELKAEKNKLFLPTCYEQLYKEAKEMNNDIAKKCFDLEKENKQLKAEVELLRQYKGSKQASYETMQIEWNEAKNEVKKLKAEKEELEYIIANKSCLTYRDFKCTKAYYTDKRLKQALQEIKDIAEENDELLQGYHKEWANNKIILQKISEVENE